MSSNEKYADSLQAMEQDRRLETSRAWAEGDNWFDDAANEEIAQQYASAQKRHIAGRPARLIAAMLQMKKICPPQNKNPPGAQYGARGVVMSESQELATVPPAETALQVFTTEKGLEPWLQQVRVKVDEFKKTLPELTTQQGRDRYASMAHQIAKSKTALEAVGKALSAKQKELPKKIDAERKRVWDTLEAWQKEVRQPLDDWQAADDARIDRHKDSIERIKALASDLEGIIADDLEGRIEIVEAVALGDQWQEFEADAARAKDESLKTLRDTLVVRKKHEAEMAEIARFNAEKAERERIEHEAAIARAATEKAQREADERAEEDRQAAAKREQDLKDQAAAQQQAAENQRLQLQLQAEQAERQAAQAKAEQIAAEQRAEQERKDAAARAEQAVEQARLDEQRRQQEAADEILRQQKAREADKAHQIKIMSAAKEALMSINITEELAKAIVLKIARREVPHITINF